MLVGTVRFEVFKAVAAEAAAARVSVGGMNFCRDPLRFSGGSRSTRPFFFSGSPFSSQGESEEGGLLESDEFSPSLASGSSARLRSAAFSAIRIRSNSNTAEGARQDHLRLF